MTSPRKLERVERRPFARMGEQVQLDEDTAIAVRDQRGKPVRPRWSSRYASEDAGNEAIAEVGRAAEERAVALAPTEGAVDRDRELGIGHAAAGSSAAIGSDDAFSRRASSTNGMAMAWIAADAR